METSEITTLRLAPKHFQRVQNPALRNSQKEDKDERHNSSALQDRLKNKQRIKFEHNKLNSLILGG